MAPGLGGTSGDHGILAVLGYRTTPVTLLPIWGQKEGPLEPCSAEGHKDGSVGRGKTWGPGCAGWEGRPPPARRWNQSLQDQAALHAPT